MKTTSWQDALYAAMFGPTKPSDDAFEFFGLWMRELSLKEDI